MSLSTRAHSEMSGAEELQALLHQLAGRMLVNFASGVVDSETATAFADLFPNSKVLSLSILAAGELLIEAGNFLHEGFTRVCFHPMTAAAGMAIASKHWVHVESPPAGSDTGKTTGTGGTDGCKSMLAVPIPGASPDTAAEGLHNLGGPATGALCLGFNSSADIDCLSLQLLALLAWQLTSHLLRYTQLPEGQKMESIFLQPACAQNVYGCSCHLCQPPAAEQAVSMCKETRLEAAAAQLVEPVAGRSKVALGSVQNSSFRRTTLGSCEMARLSLFDLVDAIAQDPQTSSQLGSLEADATSSGAKWRRSISLQAFRSWDDATLTSRILRHCQSAKADGPKVDIVSSAADSWAGQPVHKQLDRLLLRSRMQPVGSS